MSKIFEVFLNPANSKISLYETIKVKKNIMLKSNILIIHELLYHLRVANTLRCFYLRNMCTFFGGRVI